MVYSILTCVTITTTNRTFLLPTPKKETLTHDSLSHRKPLILLPSLYGLVHSRHFLKLESHNMWFQTYALNHYLILRKEEVH